MKNIYIIQNSELSFDMDLSQLYAPEHYTLFFIANHFSFEKLKQKNQEHYFEKIWLTDDFSFEFLKEIIQNNQKTSSLPFTIVTNSEESMLVSGELRKYFSIDALNYDRFINKILMKRLINKAELILPKHMIFDQKGYQENPRDYLDDITQKLTFPMIAKPIDSYNCMSVQKIHSMNELERWSHENSFRNSIYEIDEFIEGKVYNCDSYIKNKKIIFTQVSECSNSCYDFICGMTKGTIALPHNYFMYQFLSDYTEKAHEAIGLPHAGVTHLEVIISKENKPYFVEIAHRSPGILIPAMYKKFLNIGTIEPHILLQIHDSYELPIQQGPYCAWVAFPRMKGKMIKKYIPEISSEYQLEWTIEIGDKMQSVTKGRDYAGRVLLWNNNYQKLKKDFYYLNSFKFFDVENDHSVAEN